MGAGYRIQRRFRERIYRRLRRSAGTQGVVGVAGQLHGQGGLSPYGGYLRECAVVRGSFSRGFRLPEEGGQRGFGQGDYGSDAGRRLLSCDTDRYQSAQCGLDPQGARFEVGDHRQHYLRLCPGGAWRRIPRGVHAASRRPRTYRQVRQVGRRSAYRPA